MDSVKECYEVFRIKTNTQVSNILRLAACAVISTISFWYPYYLGDYYEKIAPGVDSRLGFIIFCGLPFLGGAAVFSIILVIKLFRELKSVRAKWRYLVGFTGVVLTIPSVSGVVLVCINLGIFFIYAAFQMCKELLF
jgi:hypothetical protein